MYNVHVVMCSERRSLKEEKINKLPRQTLTGRRSFGRLFVGRIANQRRTYAYLYHGPRWWRTRNPGASFRYHRLVLSSDTDVSHREYRIFVFRTPSTVI